MSKVKINPNDDGVDHINIYSKGRTELGKLLSNFWALGFLHPLHGYFVSMEGFYYYVSTGFKHEELKKLFGYRAKINGREKERIYCEDFEVIVREGLNLKVEQNPELKKLLKESSLPFKHYYVYGKDPYKVIEVKGHDWLIDGYTSIREKLKSES